MKPFVLMLFLLSPGTLWCQSRELWFSVGGSILGLPYFHTNRELGSPDSSGAPSDVQLDNGVRWGIRMAFNTAGHFGHEIQYAYNRTHLIDNTGAVLGDPGRSAMAIHQGGYNLLYYINKPESKELVFFTAGAHFSDYVLPGSAAAAQGGDLKPGFNYGVGIKLRLTPLFGLRADLRGYETGKPTWGSLLSGPGGLQHQMEASGGFGIRF